ncbi:MAG: hypothetical protein ABI978_04285 [Chloroflexota bacterium]
MKNLKTLGIAGGLVAAALVGGTLISAAFAAPSGTPTTNRGASAADAAKYCDQWKKSFADQLGVSVDKLMPAAKAATIATIDAAVKAGEMTAARGAALKAKIEAATGDGCRLLGHPFIGAGHGPGWKVGGDLLTTAATALGMQPADLIQSLHNGDSLKKIAADKGKNYATVSKAIHDAAKADLDKAVTAGLAQAKADQILANLDKALASGDFPGRFPGRGHFGLPKSPDASAS